MGYTIFNFGALYLEDCVQKIPQHPTINGDTPVYDIFSHISIRGKVQKQTISWIKPDGMNLLIADRTLLIGVNWYDLEEDGFVEGEELIVDGHRFLCRLPQLGSDENEHDEWDEWIRALDAVNQEGNTLWNWSKMGFWGRTKVSNTTDLFPVRGYHSSRYWTFDAAEHRCGEIGFRPVLEILPATDIKPNCELDGQPFCLNNFFDDNVFYPVLQPMKPGAFSGILSGERIRMYTLLKNGKPVSVNPRGKRVFKDISQLKLTDKYFGDEFLIPWVISNGIAVASRPLLYKNG